MNDPFAGLEEAPNNSSNTDQNTATDKKENTVATTENQSKIVVTLKGGSGYDAPWVVVHADTPQDALDTLNDEGTKQLLEKTKKVGAFFSAGGRKTGNGQPAASTQPANGQEPPEGYVFKSGVSQKTGKPWQAFMPIDRNSGLPAIWLNADGSRRN